MANGINPLTAFSESLVQAVAKAGESTVMVNGRHRMPASGIVYAPGLILTADHVVERDEDISVTLANGTSANASIAGRDPGNDLVLLRLEKTSATPAEKANQEAQVGQVVIALGRPSLEGIEASFGIVSAVGGPARTGRGGLLERYLRTDAIPFPGFSGGPLIDTEGRVVGLNTSGLAHGAAGGDGGGPLDARHGRVLPAPHGLAPEAEQGPAGGLGVDPRSSAGEARS